MYSSPLVALLCGPPDARSVPTELALPFGAMSPLEGIGHEQLKMKELFARLEPEVVKEVIVCTNPNTEGAYGRSLNLMFERATGYRVLDTTDRHRDSDRCSRPR